MVALPRLKGARLPVLAPFFSQDKCSIKKVMTNKVRKIDFDFEEWHALIGRAIVACGEIELIAPIHKENGKNSSQRA